MDAIFTLNGRITGPDGGPIAKLVVAIVDEDALDQDDLLGVGVTDEDGRFKLSFASSEFQQDTLEIEETPDIKIIASLVQGEGLKPIFARAFPDLTWAGGGEDLGDIQIAPFDLNNPVFLDDVEALPGADKRAQKLSIDDEMVAACFAEVLPLVEHYTGWSNLAEGLKIEVVDSLAPTMLRELFKEKAIAADSLEAKFTGLFMDACAGYGAGGGLYDPTTHTVLLNRQCLEQNGIETLKIILGHELVHAGQFVYTPGLAAYALDYQRRSLGLVIDPDPQALQKRRMFMVELEGYATYIERDFLRKRHYPFASSDYHSSVVDMIVQVAAALLASSDDKAAAAEGSVDDKFKQYEEGVALYRSRATPERPAPWTLKVEDLPGA